MQNLSELICTRLSHDIIGNVGAVANAVELLEEGDLDFLDDIKSILNTSSNVLSSRLKFFRLAFGLSNTGLENQTNISTITKDYLSTIGGKNKQIFLDWAEISPKYVKLALLSVMSIADILPQGGSISVKPYQKGVLIQHNEDAKFSEAKLLEIKSIINSGGETTNAQYAPLVYMLKLVKNMDINIYMINKSLLGFVFE